MNSIGSAVVLEDRPRGVEVVAKATRRRFTAAHKFKVLREADASRKPGEIDKLTIENHGLPGGTASIESIRFEDGTVWDAAAVRAMVSDPGSDEYFSGSTADDAIDVGDGNDSVWAGAGNDTLNGRRGADTLIGGLGDDVYVVDQSGDAVTESADEGFDTVRSSVDYTLGANVEKLVLTGEADIGGTGNDLDNTLVGNAAAIGQFINRASYLLILWFGAHLVMDGKLTVVQLIAFQMLSGRVSDPVLRLVQNWQDFRQVGLSLRVSRTSSTPGPSRRPMRTKRGFRPSRGMSGWKGCASGTG